MKQNSNSSQNIVKNIINSIKPKQDKWALVLEGGAMRSIFTAGVLDSLHHLTHKFDIIIGVSAGSSCGASFATKQRGRMQNIFLNYLASRKFLDYSRVFSGNKSVMNLSYAISEISNNLVPLKLENLSKSHVACYATVTCVETGEAEYLRMNEVNAINSIMASCNIPFLTREPIKFNNKQYVDGGLSAPIPVQEAIDMGATKIVTILTRPHGYRDRSKSFITSILSSFFKKFKKLEDLIQKEHLTYNTSKEFVENFQDPNIELITIMPPENFTVEIFTRDKTPLLEGYAQGFVEGNKFDKILTKKMNNNSINLLPILKTSATQIIKRLNKTRNSDGSQN